MTKHWTDIELVNFLALHYDLFNLKYVSEEEKSILIKERQMILQELMERLEGEEV